VPLPTEFEPLRLPFECRCSLFDGRSHVGDDQAGKYAGLLRADKTRSRISAHPAGKTIRVV
jgi:hypothetical protein